jgi:hypothetical protein
MHHKQQPKVESNIKPKVESTVKPKVEPKL